MTADEIIQRMEEILDTNEVFDLLEMFDSHECKYTYEHLMESTCVLRLDKANLDDVMRAM